MTQVKIFGAHDERTKEQMARCMQYGSVVGDVLCADGHLGHAQPVGGVLASRRSHPDDLRVCTLTGIP